MNWNRSLLATIIIQLLVSEICVIFRTSLVVQFVVEPQAEAEVEVAVKDVDLLDQLDLPDPQDP